MRVGFTIKRVLIGRKRIDEGVTMLLFRQILVGNFFVPLSRFFPVLSFFSFFYLLLFFYFSSSPFLSYIRPLVSCAYYLSVAVFLNVPQILADFFEKILTQIWASGYRFLHFFFSNFFGIFEFLRYRFIYACLWNQCFGVVVEFVESAINLREDLTPNGRSRRDLKVNFSVTL